MSKYYKDYLWKDGIPYGVEAIAEITKNDSYKIVADPQNKRISIEKYLQGSFSTVIYDSLLLDFRHLKQPEQLAWQKIPINESQDLMVCLIRNEEDRVLFMETHVFVSSLCRECHVSSPQGISLSIHKMFYKSLGDSFDGIILYDQNEHPVMCKHYAFDEITQQYTTLQKEEWQMEVLNHQF